VTGLLPNYPSAPYQVTKHAVVGLTESLYHTLAKRESKVKVSLLCPGWVKTSILKSERNRPAELQNKPGSLVNKREAVDAYRKMQESLEAGISIEECTDITFKAIQDEQLYVLTHPEYNSNIQERMEHILQGTNP